ncbi:MAG: hypothetical protein ING44_11080 [Telmatospirillum sp.]|jgi:hypothetical protein|nr:hypothetical protein [Telmatospirillum sp.]
MIDAIINVIQFDEFVVALAGHLATEVSAKVTFTAVKAFGIAMIGALALPRSEATPQPTISPRRRVRKRKASKAN